MRRFLLSAVFSVCCVVLAAAPSLGQRPVTPTLLPDSTVAMIRINNVPEMIEKSRQGNLGRMLADPEIAPFAQNLYGSGAEAFKRVEEELGVSLDDLLGLPQGEICVALCSTTEGPPAFVVLFEAVNKLEVFDKLVARAEKEMLKEGGDFKKKTETVGSTEITILEGIKDDETPDIVYFKKEGVFSVITNVELAKNMLSIWEGIPLPPPKTETTEKSADTKPAVATPLASNKLYNAVMSRCGLNDPDPPHITYYFRPIEIVKAFTFQNVFARSAIDVFTPRLGIDTLLAVGGSITIGPGDFDSIQQMHVLVDNPRKGIMEAIALEPGEVTPEKFVPKDCVSYMTFNVNVQKSFTAIETVVDGFRGEGALLSMMKNNLSTPTGVDFELDILANLANRGTYFQWVERPVKLNSQRTVGAFHLKDVVLAGETLKKFAEKYPDRIETATFEDVTYYKTVARDPSETPSRPGVELSEDQRRLQIEMRPIPAWGIIDDCLVVTDRPAMFEKCLLTLKDPSSSLISDSKFKVIAENVNKYMKGGKPAAFMFQRPEESFRFMYDLANEQSSKDFLQNQSASNPFFGAVNKAMNESPLPPFSKIEQYMAPAGSLILSDETGFHLFGFGMKPETAEPKKK